MIKYAGPWGLKKLRADLTQYNVPVLINDRIDVHLAVGESRFE